MKLFKIICLSGKEYYNINESFSEVEKAFQEKRKDTLFLGRKIVKIELISEKVIV